MHLPLLQALIRNEVSPQEIDFKYLIEMAEKYQNPNSAEYKLVELALNIVLGNYLTKVSKLI